MTKSIITHDYVRDFLKEIEPAEKGLLDLLEKEAEETNVPIIPLEVKSFMTTVLEMKRPKTILEVGTAIGYSAILMSQYLDEKGKIVTIERNPKMQVRAKKNIETAKLENTIEMRQGDALDVLPTLTGQFDFIFIDAAKGHYHTFFDHAKRLLADGGIIMADNVLHKGMVAKDRYDIPRRQRTIHTRMRAFLEDMLNDPLYKASILPIGDGVAICYKK